MTTAPHAYDLREASLKPHGFIAVCYRCAKRIEATEPRFADIKGPPFIAYYCAPCARKIAKGDA